MLRFGSLSISAVVAFFGLLIFLSAIFPRLSYAQTVIPGVTCSSVNGVYVCTQQGTGGQACVSDAGTGVSLVCENMVTGGTSSSGTTAMGTGLGNSNQGPASSPGTGWLSKLTWWIAYAIQTVFVAIISFLKDLVTYVLGVILSLVSAAISAIGTPSWISNYSLSSVFGQAGAVVAYLLGELQVPTGLGLIGAGYAFRLGRKFATLFQW
ncbi:hypothetical protein [Dyella psychrodurans]|uniref:DUF2523 domain-containing protein n=1 Tax=Dyella psychrodurans TaxID=1927960 RepID=A0A370XCI6_9GAMM|nr:hypothetical protein [Dyella psychrodurans]RDS86118.1 hypothetical protein DWU99_02280 [Dyella psychrodurans]